MSVVPRSRLREVLGFALLTAIVLELLSGLAIAFHYVPSPERAHASLMALEADYKHGRSLRAMHWIGASTVVGLTLLALLQAFFTGAYKKPGRVAWLSGVLVVLTVIALGVTGELLPWTQQAVAATEVRTGLVAFVPEGEVARVAALGGDRVAGPALTRFHTLHTMVLPLVLVALLAWHLRARRHARGGLSLTLPQAFAGIVLAAAIALASRELRAPLGGVHVEGQSGFEAVPEWHFLWLNKLLKLTPPEYGAWAALFGPAILLGLVLLLPVIDFGRSRAFRHRWHVLVPGTLVILAIVGLSVWNARELPEPKPVLPYDLAWNAVERHGYRLARRLECFECHVVERDGVVYGETQHEAPHLDSEDVAASVEDLEIFALFLEDPDVEDMPAYDYVSEADRLAIGRFLQRLTAERTAR